MTITSSKSKVDYMVQLDGIRAFAVTGVILEHWASGFPRILRELIEFLDFGALGVQCFFVLSGFLITLILLGTKTQNLRLRDALGHFYVRRVLRIFPAYYITLFVMIIVFPDNVSAISWHVLYLSNIYPLWHNGAWPPIGGHLWTLSVEEQFYIFWPLIVLLVPVRIISFVTLGCCLLAPMSRVIFSLVLGGGHLAVYTFTSNALDLLCVGAFLAVVRHHLGLPADGLYTKRLRLIGLVALLFYVILYCHFRDTLLFAAIGRSLASLFFGALIIHAANGFNGPIGYILSNRAVVWVGTISYGLYIFHSFIPGMYVYLLHFFNFDLEIFGTYYIRYPLLVIMLLLLTSTSFYLLESPVRGLRKLFL